MNWIHRLVSRKTGLLLTAILISGCGSSVEIPEYAAELIPVTGIVTANGQPVTGANVIFHPEGSGNSQTAYGRTDAEGRYTLTTPIAGLSLEQQAGAVAGAYKVTVSRIARPDGSPIAEGVTEADAMAEGARETVPPMLTDPSRSPITMSVDGSRSDYDLSIRLMK